VCGVEAWCEKRCTACEGGKAARDEPAAHVCDEEETRKVFRCSIGSGV
jgi:hypothetical protein